MAAKGVGRYRTFIPTHSESLQAVQYPSELYELKLLEMLQQQAGESHLLT